MHKIIPAALLLFVSLTARAQTPIDSIALATAKWQIEELGGGAQSRYAQIDLFGSRQYISLVSYPGRKFTTALVHLDRKGYTTSELGEATGSRVAINGSYFNMKSYEPVTFVLLNRQVLGHTTPEEVMRTNGIVAIRDKRGRKVDILFCDTSEYARIARRYRSALASGPVLVHQGKIVQYDSDKSFYTNRHPRTFIGKRANGEVVMVVIDGRFKDQADGATIAEAAYIARQLGLVDALNLDGGGSSALWTATQGVVSHPSDNGQYDHEGERPVPNGIVARWIK